MHYWSLPQEAPAKQPEKEPEPEWPQRGMIEYKGVWMRYRPELDPVLRGGPGRGRQRGHWGATAACTFHCRGDARTSQACTWP